MLKLSLSLSLCPVSRCFPEEATSGARSCSSLPSPEGGVALRHLNSHVIIHWSSWQRYHQLPAHSSNYNTHCVLYQYLCTGCKELHCYVLAVCVRLDMSWMSLCTAHTHIKLVSTFSSDSGSVETKRSSLNLITLKWLSNKCT